MWAKGLCLAQTNMCEGFLSTRVEASEWCFLRLLLPTGFKSASDSSLCGRNPPLAGIDDYLTLIQELGVRQLTTLP